jgi:hypothetical protein
LSEHDLDLKLTVRRLYWLEGMSTRLNVKLRTHVAGAPSSRAKTEEFTDLDVLGISQSAGGKVVSAIGDCKTVRKQANERCFWLRGVADFFEAETAHLVRSHDVPVSTRQLATRLNLGVLTTDDLRATLAWFDGGSVTPGIELLFDRNSIARQNQLISGVDNKLSRLTDYRDFGYWIVEPHRTIDGVIHNLSIARELLNPKDPAHRSLVLDMVWLFCLALSHAASHVRDTYAANVELALQQYMFGGPAGLRDKQQQAAVLDQLLRSKGTARPKVQVFPEYFPGLLETVTRHVRRPALGVEIMRYAEWLTLAASDKDLRTTPVAAVYGPRYEPVAGKLLGDTIQFLVGAAALDRGFADLVDLTSPFDAVASTRSSTLHSDSHAATQGVTQ